LSESLNVAEADPFYLTSQDIVHVPRSKIVELNQWVEQHITRMFPNIQTFRYERTLPLGEGNERYGLGQ
jgi:disulfide oxidoreductase YuzD